MISVQSEHTLWGVWNKVKIDEIIGLDRVYMIDIFAELQNVILCKVIQLFFLYVFHFLMKYMIEE